MKISAVFCFTVLAFGSTSMLFAQQQRNLWVAKFEGETKAASAVAAVQASDENGLKYSNLFGQVTAFDASPTQPAGSWSLTAKELDFSGGSAAARALVGYGAGRAHIEMQYELRDPEGKTVWTQKIKTKPSFWGATGAVGAVQNQGQAESDQAQKLIDALGKFFGAPASK